MTRLLWCVVILLVLVSKPAMMAPSCYNVITNVAPCVTYLRGEQSGQKINQPSKNCCAGFKRLVKAAKSKQDRIAVCKCMKRALSVVNHYNCKRIPLIPKKCGVSFAMPPIDRYTDCSRAFRGAMDMASSSLNAEPGRI